MIAKSQTVSARLALAGTVLFLGLPHLSAVAGEKYTTIDAPKASSNPGYDGTMVVGINKLGEIAGNYSTNTGALRGFVREPDGQFHTFAPAGSTRVYVQAINHEGDIVGEYVGAAPYYFHGFVRTPDRHIKIIDVPGSTGDTVAHGINSHGTVIGEFQTTRGYSAYIMTADGAFQTFAIDGAYYTVACSINEAGEVAGWFLDSNVVTHGFKRSADGTLTPFDPPGSSHTEAAAINSSGDIAGTYSDSAGVSHGYVRYSNGTFSVVDAPNSASTWVVDIGHKGGLVGWSRSAEAVTHGFDRSVDGRIVTIKFPKARGTIVVQKGSHGEIVGFYWDSSKVIHGFLRSPVSATQ